MLSKEEKRFIRYWQEQREGGKVKYFLAYLIAGTIMLSLFIFVALLFGLSISPSIFIFSVVPVCAFILAFLLTAIGWTRNERRFRQLLKREIDAGKKADQIDPSTPL